MNTYRNLYIYNKQFMDSPITLFQSIYRIYQKLDVKNLIYVSSYWEYLYDNSNEWEELKEEIEILKHLSPDFYEKIIFSTPHYPGYKVSVDTIHSPISGSVNPSKSAIVVIEGNMILMDQRRMLIKRTKDSNKTPMVYGSHEDQLYDISQSIMGERIR